MSEVESVQNQEEPQILHYYNYRNISVKLVKKGDKYVVTTKKHILFLFKKIKRFEYASYNAAEDKYLEIKSGLQYRGRSY